MRVLFVGVGARRDEVFALQPAPFPDPQTDCRRPKAPRESAGPRLCFLLGGLTGKSAVSLPILTLSDRNSLSARAAIRGYATWSVGATPSTSSVILSRDEAMNTDDAEAGASESATTVTVTATAIAETDGTANLVQVKNGDADNARTWTWISAETESGMETDFDVCPRKQSARGSVTVAHAGL